MIDTPHPSPPSSSSAYTTPAARRWPPDSCATAQAIASKCVPPGPCQPTDQPVAVEAMGELGIDITAEQPKVLTTEAVQASDVVITMGCGDACRSSPASATRTGSSTTGRGRASTPSVRSATRSAPASNSWSANSSERLRLPCTVPGPRLPSTASLPRKFSKHCIISAC